jgi:hypothetical protein
MKTQINKSKSMSAKDVKVLKTTSNSLSKHLLAKGTSEKNDAQKKRYNTLLEKSLSYLNSNIISEFPTKDLVKIEDSHLIQLAEWINKRKQKSSKDKLLANFILKNLKNDRQLYPLKEELTLRFIERLYPNEETPTGEYLSPNLELLNADEDLDVSSLLEPWYSNYEVRLEFIKNKGLMEKYISFLYKELQDAIYENSPSNDKKSLKEGLIDYWFVEKDELEFVGLMPNKKAKKTIDKAVQPKKNKIKGDLDFEEKLKEAFKKRFPDCDKC